MTPAALKVATDILRELGMDDVALWVEHPEAVRHLLNYGAQSTDASFEEHSECFDCGSTGAHGRRSMLATGRRSCASGAARLPHGALSVTRAAPLTSSGRTRMRTSTMATASEPG